MLEGEGEAFTVSIAAAVMVAAEGDVSDGPGLAAESVAVSKETDGVVEGTTVVDSAVSAPAFIASSVSSTVAAVTVVVACDVDGEACPTFGAGRIDQDDNGTS